MLFTFSDSNSDLHESKDYPSSDSNSDVNENKVYPINSIKNDFDKVRIDNHEEITTNVEVDSRDIKDNIDQFNDELKKFVMLTKNLQFEVNDRKGVRSEMVKRCKVQSKQFRELSLTDYLSNRRDTQSEEKVTSTEIIFQNSASFDWTNYSDARVTSLYKNKKDIVTTSCDTLHSIALAGRDMQWLASHCSGQVSNKTIEPVSSIDRTAESHRAKKTRASRGDTICQRNFVKTNKILTKYILKGRQKVHTADKMNSWRRGEMKWKRRPAVKKNKAECQVMAEQRSEKKSRCNKRKVDKEKQLDNIIITDILYLI